ncbi:hypothetical protein MOQ_010195, partial [Trypanosoma cruzi marinkellei]
HHARCTSRGQNGRLPSSLPARHRTLAARQGGHPHHGPPLAAAPPMLLVGHIKTEKSHHGRPFLLREADRCPRREKKQSEPQRSHTSSTRSVIVIAITPVAGVQPSAQTNSPSTQSKKKKKRHGRYTTHSHRTATNGSTPAAAVHTPRDTWNQYDCRTRTPPANQKFKSNKTIIKKKEKNPGSTAHAYQCVRDAFNVTDVGHNAEHTAGQQKQGKQNTIIIFSYLLHRTTTHAHTYPAVECWHALPAHTSSAQSGARQRGCGEQQRGTHPRRAAEAAVDFAQT